MACSEKHLETRWKKAADLMEQVAKVQQNYVSRTARVADESSLLKEIPLRTHTELLIHRNSSSLAFKPRVKSSS
jgi:hypothetical protein